MARKQTSTKRRTRTGSRSSQRRRGVVRSRVKRPATKAAKKPASKRPKKATKAKQRRAARSARRAAKKKASKPAPSRKRGGNPTFISLANPDVSARLADAKAKLAAARRRGDRQSELLWADLVNTLEAIGRAQRRNPAGKRGLPPGYRVTPAKHGLHGFRVSVRVGGRWFEWGLDFPRRDEAVAKAWAHYHSNRTKKNPKKVAKTKATAKRPAKRRRSSTTTVRTVTTATTRTTKTNPGIDPVLERAIRAAMSDRDLAKIDARFVSGYLDQPRSLAEIHHALTLVIEQRARARKKNPSRGRKAKRNCGPCALNPSRGVKVGTRIRWADLPASVRRDPRARSAARREATFAGIPMADVVFEFTDRIPEGMSPFAIHVGDTLGVQYRPPRGSKRAAFDWDHKAGDHGRGKRRTRPAALVVDQRTGAHYFLPRRGSRLGFSSRRGLIG